MTDPTRIIPVFTPAQARTLQLVAGGNIFVPELYNAVGNGITDDTQAVNDAIEAAAAVNGVVYLWQTYLVSEVSLRSNVTITGGGTIKRKSGSVTYALACTGEFSPYSNITIDGIIINGNKAQTSAGGGIGISGTNNTIRNCYIYNCPNAAINYGYQASAYGAKILNNYCLNNGKNNSWGAIGVTGGLDTQIIGNQIVCTDGQQSYGIDIEPNAMDYSGIGRILIANNQIIGGRLLVDGGNLTGGALEGVSVVGNIIDARGSYPTGFDNEAAIFVRKAKNIKFSANEIYSIGSAASANTIYGMNLKYDIDGCTVKDNDFYIETPAAGGQCIRGQGTSGHPVTNCSFCGNEIVGTGANTLTVGIYAYNSTAGDHWRAVGNTMRGNVTALYQIGDTQSYYEGWKDSTANRPVAGRIQTGDMVLDTTLDADGYPIWWQGTKFIKSDGSNA